MSRGLLFLTLPLMLIAGVALAKGIASLRLALRLAEVAVLPLAGVSAVEASEPGRLILALRGRLGSRDFASASFALRDSAGQAVPSSPILVRSARTSLEGETTLAVRSFTLSAPGRYELHVTGLDQAAVGTSSRLVLSRPRGTSVAWRVVWVVAAGVVLPAAIVSSALSAFSPPAIGPRPCSLRQGHHVFLTRLKG